MSNKKMSITLGALSLLLFALCRNQIPLHNISFYLCSCIIFIAVASFCYIILEHIISSHLIACGKKTFYQTDKGETVFSGLIVFVFFIWMIFFFKYEESIDSLGERALLRQRFPFLPWLLAVFTLMGISLVLIGLMSRSKEDASSSRFSFQGLLRFVISIFFTAYTVPIFFAPNLFLDIQGDTYHSTAYTNSIIMTCWRTPYSWRMHDYYGHYGILYMPFLKLMRRFLGVNFWIGTCIMIAVFSAISILGFLYVLNYFIKNDVIYYLSMFAIGNEFYMLMRGGEYYQVFPHRLLFPILLVAYAIWEKKHHKKTSVGANVFLILLLTVSTIWSVEVGSVGLLSFVAYRWIEHIYDGNAFSLKKALSLIKYGILYFLLPFGLAYLAVGLYNVWAGGDLFMEFKEYMYPLISDKGYIEHIELPLPGAQALWVGMTIFFLTIACLSALPAIFSKETPKPLYPLYFLMSIMSVGLLTYYINRPVYSTVAVDMYFAIIMVGVVFEKAQHYYLAWQEQRKSSDVALPSAGITPGKTIFYRFFRLVALFILTIMFTDSIYYLPQVYPMQKETVWKLKEFDEFAQHIYVQVPPQAVYLGEGVPELAAYLDRDPGIHCTEWSINNMTKEEEADVWREVKEAMPQWMLWNTGSLAQVQEKDPGFTDAYYRVNDVWEYGKSQFAFFIRKDE